MSIVSKYS